MVRQTEQDGTADLLFAGDGPVAAELRAVDWAAHPLGVPGSWDPALRVALGLVLNSPESMILAWGDDLHFFFNDTYAPLLGHRRPGALGGRLADVWADGWAQAAPIIAEALAGRPARFTDLPWTLSDGAGERSSWWSFSYSRVLDAAGRVAGLFILTNETTARVRSDAALARSQEALEAALADLGRMNEDLERRVAERTAERDRMWHLSPDLLAIIDADGRFVRVNPAWQALLGHDPDEVAARDLMTLVHPEDLDRTRTALTGAQRAARRSFENRLRHDNGDYRWFSWITVPHGTEILASGRHVTAAKEAETALRHAETQLRQTQKMEALGQLTGGVAHDFNNLLTVIQGSADLLRRADLPEPRRQRYVGAIRHAAARAATLTSQLLAFSRRQALRPERFDVGASLREVLDVLATLGGARVSIGLELADEPLLVEADRAQFDTAMVNIAANARDAMNGSGRLLIRVAPVDQIPPIRAHPAVAGSFVSVVLADTGPGIPADRLDHVFEPFYTTKKLGQGTGLGLSQVFGFAKQSGGEVAAANGADGGAIVTLFLPRVPAPPAEPDSMAATPTGALAIGAHILVVDDDPAVGTFALGALAELGFQASLAGDARAALARLDAGETFDALLTDVMMPGVSGIDLALTVRRRFPALPVVLASGYSSILADTGTQGFELLHKPFTLDALARALHRAAGRTG